MPALEMAQETGKLVSWKKKEGDSVKKGELLLEVENRQGRRRDRSGRRRDPRRSHGAGRRCRAGRADDCVAAEARRDAANLQCARADGSHGRGRHAASRCRSRERRRSAGRSAGGRGRRQHQDLAESAAAREGTRRRHHENQGHGAGGEIVAEDVLAAKGSAAPAAAARTAAAAGSPAPAPSMPPVSTEIGALSSIGRIMAERTTQSWTTAPHFFVSREVDGTGLVAAREKFGLRSSGHAASSSRIPIC